MDEEAVVEAAEAAMVIVAACRCDLPDVMQVRSAEHIIEEPLMTALSSTLHMIVELHWNLFVA